MNVFVLCTGRCGSTTITRAFGHATNFTAGLETEATTFYPLDYPDQHIEADNRLSWMLGALARKFPAAVYIHLIRNQEEVARSWESRRDYPGASIKGFGAGILGLGDAFHQQRYKVGLRQWEIVNANIEEFLFDRVYERVWLHELTQSFAFLWEWLGCEGDLDAGIETTRSRFNAGVDGATIAP